jgi:hypothetical protein
MWLSRFLHSNLSFFFNCLHIHIALNKTSFAIERAKIEFHGGVKLKENGNEITRGIKICASSSHIYSSKVHKRGASIYKISISHGSLIYQLIT